MDYLLSAASYIARTAHEPEEWGVNDCACWAASWWKVRTGFDPAALLDGEALRGGYDTKFACRRIVMRHGGLLNLCRKLMAGVPAGGEGDGICVAKVNGTTICGIVSNGRLWLKVNRGVASPESYEILEKWVP